MKRSAKATWKGSIRVGEGTVTTGSGVLSKLIYVTGTNIGEVPSTTSTEMLAAAEAACMAVTIARELEAANIPFENIETEAEISVDINKKHPEINGIVVNVIVHASDFEPAAIEKAVNRAKHNGVVTRILDVDVKVKTHIVAATTA
jgi:osmotically inducible protein OsmC